jgi:integrase
VTRPEHPGQRPAHPWDQVFVLSHYELRDGHVLADTSRFSDHAWVLDAAIHQQHTCAVTLRFDTIAGRYRLLVKEVLCAYMTMPLPPGQDRLGLGTVRGELTELKRWFAWLETHRGGPELDSVTPDDLAAYAVHLRTLFRHSASAGRSHAAVRRIWRYRSVLPSARLLIDPGRVEGWSEKERRCRRRENSTNRLPDQVMGPLIVWASRFVDLFAPDIIAAGREWTRLRTRTSPRWPGAAPRPDLLPALKKLLARHLEEGRPLPGHRGEVNHRFLAGTLGCYSKSLLMRADLRYAIEDTAKAVGIASTTFYYTPVNAKLDETPWLRWIDREQTDTGLPVLARMLQAACYVLVGFLSGMRDSEVKHLNRGCLQVDRDTDGVPYRWKLHGRAFKGERDPKGVAASWIVGAPAARAIHVLQELVPAESNILFENLTFGGGGAKLTKPDRALTSVTTNRSLNRFVQWVNDYCRDHGRSDGIPDVDGGPWNVMSIQFRRTLAWFIARKPGGVIAGAIQFRHLSIQMFEGGYAGTSESGFRAEVESEQALARGEYLLDLADTHRHDNLVGPGAQEATHRLSEFGIHTDGFAGTVISDERRLARLMKRHDPGIYPGTYVTCVYSHDKALCRPTTDTAGNVLPELGDCKPLACRNVALTSDNVAAWRAELDDISHQLSRRPRLPPLLEHRLDQRRQAITVFLNRHTDQEQK